MRIDGTYPRVLLSRADVCFIVGLIITAILFMGDFTILGRDFGTDSWKSQEPWASAYDPHDVRSVNYDSPLEHQPWFGFAKKELLKGRLPLWDPYQFAGTPLYANHLCPVLYPPLTLSLLLFSGDDITGWLAVFHLIIFGIALYILLRVLGISPLAAFITSMAAQFTGICFVLWHPWGAAIAWMPAVIASYEYFHQTRKWKYIAWAGLFYGLMIMAAFPVIAVHFTYFLAVYFFIRGYSLPRRRVVGLVLPLLFVVLLGALISGVQNIPTAVYSTDTYRSPRYENSVAFTDPPPPAEAMVREEPAGINRVELSVIAKGRFVSPVARLRVVDNQYFIGAPLLLFALIGVFLLPAARKHWVYLFILLFIASYADPVSKLLIKWLPLWDMRDYPPREIWHLTALVCAGYGVNGLLSGDVVRLNKAVKIIIVAGCAAMFIFVAAVQHIEKTAAPALFAYTKIGALSMGITYMISLSGIIGGILLLIFPKYLKREFAIGIIIFGIALSAIPSRYIALPYTSDKPQFTPQQDDFIATLKNFAGVDGRIARITGDEVYLNFYKRGKLPFLANLPMMYEIRDISGYDSLIPKRAVDYLNLIEEHSVKLLRTHISFTSTDVLTSDLFQSLSVGCVITDFPELPGSIETKQFGGIYVHRIEKSAPKFYLALHVSVMDDDELIKPKLLHNGWVNERTVYIDGHELSVNEKKELMFDVPDKHLDAITTLIRETPTHLEFDIKLNTPSVLVLNDAYAPGWETIIDGVRGRCLNANLLFRAVYVPEGQHSVEFVYRPTYMTWGWVSSTLGLLIFLGFVIRRAKVKY